MFKLDEEQSKKLDGWMVEQEEKVRIAQGGKDKAYYGAIGGAYTYMYTPTGLGVVVQVRNNLTKEEINLTNYKDW